MTDTVTDLTGDADSSQLTVAPAPPKRSVKKKPAPKRTRPKGAPPRRSAPAQPKGAPPLPPGAPKPPRRVPPPPKPPVVLTKRERLVRGVLAILAALLIGFSVNLMLLSHLQYFASQQQLQDHFRVQLADGVAPVSEGDVFDVLLEDGVPVAMLNIPSINLETVIVEGTGSGTTMSGPGHRRDTALPGQAGTSVIMGRSAAYGGPFSRIQDLQPRDTFTVTTGQGEHTYEVMGIRYAGDPSPPKLKAGEGRIVFETSRGIPYAPNGILRVDARLVSEVKPPGIRQTNFVTLPPQQKAMATDTTMVWALVFGLQALIAIEVALVWSLRKLPPKRVWAVFIPVILLTALIITDQIMRLLPNLL